MKKNYHGHTTRRGFLKGSLIGGTIAGLPASLWAMSRKTKKETLEKPVEVISKGTEYVNTIKRYIRNFRENEWGNLMKAADICAEAYAAGHKIIYPFYGHSERKGIAEKREGSPRFLTWTRNTKAESGDAFITIRVEEAIRVRKKGTKVIGISNAFLPQKPPNYMTVGRTEARTGKGDFYEGPFLADNCDVFINDQVPYTIGIVSFEGLRSHFGNGVGVMEGYVFWTLVAAITDKLIEKGISFDVQDHSE